MQKQEIYNYQNYGSTIFPASIYPSTINELFILFPIKILHFLFGPFIWEINTIGKYVILIDSLLYLALFLILAFNFNKIYQDVSLFYIFIFIILIVCVYTLGTGNYGTAIRHKCKFLILLFVLISPIIPSFTLNHNNAKKN